MYTQTRGEQSLVRAIKQEANLPSLTLSTEKSAFHGNTLYINGPNKCKFQPKKIQLNEITLQLKHVIFKYSWTYCPH